MQQAWPDFDLDESPVALLAALSVSVLLFPRHIMTTTVCLGLTPECVALITLLVCVAVCNWLISCMWNCQIFIA